MQTDLTQRSLFFWDVTQYKLVVTDVSEPTGPIFNGKAVQKRRWDC
jgi:hypothetical protein